MKGYKILWKIAEIQLDALHNIQAHKEELDDNFIIRYIENSYNDINMGIAKLEDIYTQISQARCPDLLINLLSEYQIGICVHILFRMEDIWMNEFSQRDVMVAWDILLKAQSKFHPEYILSQVEYLREKRTVCRT